MGQVTFSGKFYNSALNNVVFELYNDDTDTKAADESFTISFEKTLLLDPGNYRLIIDGGTEQNGYFIINITGAADSFNPSVPQTYKQNINDSFKFKVN